MAKALAGHEKACEWVPEKLAKIEQLIADVPKPERSEG